LLCNGGSTARAIAFQIVFCSDLDRVPIESMVLVEVRVLCGDYSVLEIGPRTESIAPALSAYKPRTGDRHGENSPGRTATPQPQKRLRAWQCRFEQPLLNRVFGTTRKKS
jgi:hypothetical protein